MSFQAVTWAIEQKAGSPSAKATLWSIANYANEQWCAWPSQKTICDESEQSPDAVQKRLPDLEGRGLIRRIPLRFAGRKTVDFIILAPSPFFQASLSEVEPLLPRGCSVDPKFAAAFDGSDEKATADDNAPESLRESDNGAADALPLEAAAAEMSQPLTLPQIAAHAAAYERQQEPVMEPKNQEMEDGARAREPLISSEAHALASKVLATVGFDDPMAIPPDWCGIPHRAQVWLAAGWTKPIILATCRKIMLRRSNPPHPNYFETAIANAVASLGEPVPKGVATEIRHETNGTTNGSVAAAADRLVERVRNLVRERRSSPVRDRARELPAQAVPERGGG